MFPRCAALFLVSFQFFPVIETKNEEIQTGNMQNEKRLDAVYQTYRNLSIRVSGTSESVWGYCKPRKVIVKGLVGETSVFTVPKCIQVERCTGCCPDDNQKCKPTNTSTLDVELLLASINGKTEKKNVKIQQHLACECQPRKNKGKKGESTTLKPRYFSP